MNIYEIKPSSSIRPREKLLKMGAAALSDSELLALILQTGTKGKPVFSIAKDLAKFIKDNPDDVNVKTIGNISGIGTVKALKIMACLEYAKRYKTMLNRKIETASDVYKLVHDITDKEQEHFVLITLNGASCLIKKRTLFIGTVNRSIVHPREVFAHAISDRASSIIFAHNHPSGNTNPSEDDIIITKKFKEIGELLCIEVIDHLIVSKSDYFSFNLNNVL